MSGLIFHDDDGKPVFSNEYLEIEKDFVDIEPVTMLGERVFECETPELDPAVDFGIG